MFYNAASLTMLCDTNYNKVIDLTNGRTTTTSGAFALGGLVKQCLEFDVYHDVGNALLHWMHGIPAVWIRNKGHMSLARRLRSDTLGFHGIGRPPHHYSMRQIADTFASPRRRADPGKHPSQLIWFNEYDGYKNNSHYRKYGHPTSWNGTWHTMPTQRCSE